MGVILRGAEALPTVKTPLAKVLPVVEGPSMGAGVSGQASDHLRALLCLKIIRQTIAHPRQYLPTTKSAVGRGEK